MTHGLSLVHGMREQTGKGEKEKGPSFLSQCDVDFVKSQTKPRRLRLKITRKSKVLWQLQHDEENLVKGGITNCWTLRFLHQWLDNAYLQILLNVNTVPKYLVPNELRHHPDREDAADEFGFGVGNHPPSLPKLKPPKKRQKKKEKQKKKNMTKTKESDPGRERGGRGRGRERGANPNPKQV